jgi:hypothetical protein
MCVSPDFYFYDLITGILPVGCRQSFAVAAEDARDWLIDRDFEPELEDVSADSYDATFMKEDVKLDLTLFRKLPSVSKVARCLEPTYTGNLYVELSMHEDECEIDIRFSVDCLRGPSVEIPLNYITMNHLVFSDE